MRWFLLLIELLACLGCTSSATPASAEWVITEKYGPVFVPPAPLIDQPEKPAVKIEVQPVSVEVESSAPYRVGSRWHCRYAGREYQFNGRMWQSCDGQSCSFLPPGGAATNPTQPAGQSSAIYRKRRGIFGRW